MPALPSALVAARAAQDSRNLDARQLHGTFTTLTARASHLAERLPMRRLWTRQHYKDVPGAIPTVYAGINAGPSPGAVVGIVLGSVAGFLLLIWLFWILSQGNAFIRTTAIEEEDYVTTRRHHSSRSHRSRRTEMRDRSPRRDRIIRQERIVRDRNMPISGSIPPPRAPSRIRETIVVDEPERRVEGDDIVEVIEEHSSIDVPPRRKSRRSSGYRRDQFSDLGN